MRAAILEKLHAPLTVADIETPVISHGMDSLDHGQVFVKMIVAGICGSQLQEIDGHKGDPSHLPHFLGHEGAGLVAGIGPGVKRVKKGDKVVLHWRKGAGCEADPPVFWNGSRSPIGHVKAGPITTFSEYTIVSENRCTAIPHDVPNDFAALLGCSLSTALGVIENEAKVKFGESVLIIGCGGLGLSLILAAKLAHAYPIVAIDKVESKKAAAESLGAMFCDAECGHKMVRYDVIIDTTGHVLHMASLAPSGRYIMVGQPDPMVAYLQVGQASRLFEGTGKTIKATQGGCFSPETDIPRYVNLWRSGAFETIIDEPYGPPLIDESYKRLITHRVTLDNINQGIDLVRSGKAGRVMIDFA